MTHEIKVRVRELIAQVAEEMGIEIENGVISSDHLHIFVSILPYIAVSEFVQKVKGRLSRKVQLEFSALKKKYWGKHSWERGHFSSTSGNITDDIINDYINKRSEAKQPDSVQILGWNKL